MFAVVVITEENINEILEHFKNDGRAQIDLSSRAGNEDLLLMFKGTMKYCNTSSSDTFHFSNWYIDYPSISDALGYLLITSERARKAYEDHHMSNTWPKALKETVNVSNH